MLKVEELRGLAVEELAEKANKLKKELMQYRFQAKTGKLERQSTLGEVKRDIARVLTIMNEKSAEGSVAAPAPKVAVKKVVAKKAVAKKGVKS